jgi:hypothetical protein
MTPSASAASPPRWQLAALVALGAGDLVTGVALVAAPAFVLGLLGFAPVTPAATIFVRWIGVFVAAIGGAYLLPFRVGDKRERHERLRAALEWTALVRLAVAAFVAIAVLTAALPERWCFVGGYDAFAATAQLALLAAWARPRER